MESPRLHLNSTQKRQQSPSNMQKMETVSAYGLIYQFSGRAWDKHGLSADGSGPLVLKWESHSTSHLTKKVTYCLSSTACPEIGRKQNLHGADGRHGDDYHKFVCQKLGEILSILFVHLFVHEIRAGSNSSHFGISERE